MLVIPWHARKTSLYTLMWGYLCTFRFFANATQFCLYPIAVFAFLSRKKKKKKKKKGKQKNAYK